MISHKLAQGYTNVGLLKLYTELMSARIWPLVCFDVRPEQLTFDNFKAFVLSPDVAFFLIEHDNKPTSIAYLTHFEGNTARIHFLPVRRGVPKELGRQMGRYMIRHLFEKWKLSALLGLYRSADILTHEFAKDLGGVVLGDIPGALHNGKHKCSMDGRLVIYTPDVLTKYPKEN